MKAAQLPVASLPWAHGKAGSAATSRCAAHLALACFTAALREFRNKDSRAIGCFPEGRFLMPGRRTKSPPARRSINSRTTLPPLPPLPELGSGPLILSALTTQTDWVCPNSGPDSWTPIPGLQTEFPVAEPATLDLFFAGSVHNNSPGGGTYVNIFLDGRPTTASSNLPITTGYRNPASGSIVPWVTASNGYVAHVEAGKHQVDARLLADVRGTEGHVWNGILKVVVYPRAEKSGRIVGRLP